MKTKEDWRNALRKYKNDKQYEYLIELLLPYTAGMRSVSLDNGLLPILCEVDDLIARDRKAIFNRVIRYLGSFGEVEKGSQIDLRLRDIFRL